jgi:hypothetical protein
MSCPIEVIFFVVILDMDLAVIMHKDY